MLRFVAGDTSDLVDRLGHCEGGIEVDRPPYREGGDESLVAEGGAGGVDGVYAIGGPGRFAWGTEAVAEAVGGGEQARRLPGVARRDSDGGESFECAHAEELVAHRGTAL